ncbi:MAG: hypothetical protein CVV23_01520 [Ignavibacteriae bacterium HGW-Ignavibacteriae-2]|jgi:xanthine dehydrogenase accessory factor|nr:XdhC/CoxI family protein [Bacteroidota bacterium]PKL90047.1 MAG: hypothetical protein CVV23_01520 [Ignavibacteriae bacterium HGW-Ignavibacteriae-2]
MNILGKASQLIESNSPFVLTTVIESKGSSPGKSGFKMIVLSNGETIGTVGGGAIEVKVKEHAMVLLNNGCNEFKDYLLDADKEVLNSEKEIVPMMCKGSIKIYYEVFGKMPTLYVFGGGHVGQALCKLIADIGYYTILIDNRKDFATREKNPYPNDIIHADYLEYADEFKPQGNSFVVILTHGHKYDFGILQKILSRKLSVKYIGVIASNSKAAKIVNDIKESLGKDVDLSMLHSPIGLKIGGDSAIEIALSIAAEMQSVRYNQKLVF